MKLRAQYLEKRNELLAKAKEHIGKNELEEAKAVREEIEALDADYETASKEQANLNALEGKKVGSIQSVNPAGAQVVENLVGVSEKPSYEDVFSKVALKRDLTPDEIEVFNQYNPTNVYTHDTSNTEILIPETVVGGIESMMAELHPILNDVMATRIKGTVKYIKHTGVPAGDADYYTEDEVVADEENTFGELVLGGKELAKAVTVTWKLQEMAVTDFIPFLQKELSERMAYAKARAFIRGAGDAKHPEGVITALNAESGTPQVIAYTDSLGYSDLTNAMSKIKSVYVGGAKIYANNTTVWNVLANIMDANNRPIFVPDVTSGGVGRIFGLPVMPEDGMNDNEVLLANMGQGYKENIQDAMKLVTDQQAKARKTDFVAYQVHDGGVSDTGAFAYLKKGV